MKPPASLEALQSWMQQAITHPRGVTAGASLESINSTLAASSRQTAAERLSIYERAYFARLVGCLESMFPALREALEEESFAALAIAYLDQHPPGTYTLATLADQFVACLRTTRPAREGDAPDHFDFLIDLAELEHTIDKVFDGPGSEHLAVLTLADLQGLTPDALASARLVLNPSLRLLTFQFPVNDYYTRFRQGRAASSAAKEFTSHKSAYLAVFRRDYVVQRLPLVPGGYHLLAALAAGETVENAISRGAAEYPGTPDEFPGELQAWFRDWGTAGLFVGVNHPERGATL